MIYDVFAALPQAFDDPGALIEIYPKIAGIEPFHLLLTVAEQLPDPGVVKQQQTILVDNVKAGRAMIQNFPELTLVLGDLSLALPQRGDVVDPQHAFTADETDVTAAIGGLRVG